MTLADTAAELRRLHTAPELLQVVNVWDVASAEAIAALAQTRAIATASHSIAAAFGYPDGEQIPADLMLGMVGRIARAVDVPVSADLEAVGDPGETIRRAIGGGSSARTSRIAEAAAIEWLAVAIARVCARAAMASALATSHTLTTCNSSGAVWRRRNSAAVSARVIRSAYDWTPRVHRRASRRHCASGSNAEDPSRE